MLLQHGVLSQWLAYALGIRTKHSYITCLHRRHCHHRRSCRCCHHRCRRHHHHRRRRQHHLFSFRRSVQDYKIQVDMEIVTF
jgi:hypothetical protein